MTPLSRFASFPTVPNVQAVPPVLHVSRAHNCFNKREAKCLVKTKLSSLSHCSRPINLSRKPSFTIDRQLNGTFYPYSYNRLCCSELRKRCCGVVCQRTIQKCLEDDELSLPHDFSLLVLRQLTVPSSPQVSGVGSLIGTVAISTSPSLGFMARRKTHYQTSGGVPTTSMCSVAEHRSS